MLHRVLPVLCPNLLFCLPPKGQEVYSLHMGLMLIYLSITVFILSSCLQLAPCCLSRISLKPLPMFLHSLWTLLLLQEVLLGNVYPSRARAGFLLGPRRPKPHSLEFLTLRSRDQKKGVALLLSQMGALSCHVIPVGSRQGLTVLLLHR